MCCFALRARPHCMPKKIKMREKKNRGGWGVGVGGGCIMKQRQGPKMEVFLPGRDRLFARGTLRKALAVQQSGAFSWGVEVCSTQHPLWQPHTGCCRELEGGRGEMLEKKALTFIYSGRPRPGLFSSVWREGKKHEAKKRESRWERARERERKTSFSLFLSVLQGPSSLSLVSVHTLVWGLGSHAEWQDGPKKKSAKLTCFSFLDCPSVSIV